MKKILAVLVVLFFVGGCAVNPIPNGYTGPTAMIKDFVGVEPEEHPGTPMFYLSKVDGQDVPDSESATRLKNNGRGPSMDPETVERLVPARKMKLTLVARNVHAAPIQEIFHSMRGNAYKAEGTVDFDPKPDGVYIVKGTIGPSGTAVWLEDFRSNEIVTQKIEAPQKK